jgi:integrase
MQLLRQQQKEQACWKLKAGAAWENKLDLVFTNELGQHYAHNTLSRNFKRVAAKIGLHDNCFHDLRHTYAVAAIQSGDDIKTVQENLGHHTAAFTLDTYGHVTERMKQNSAERMEGYIQGLVNL